MSSTLPFLLLAFSADAYGHTRSTNLAPVGVVRAYARGHATGFIVGECEVLTVKHAFGSVRTALGRRVRFEQHGPRKLQSWGTVIVEGEHNLVRDWWAKDRLGDWLLIRLDQCLGRDASIAHLSPTPIHLSPHWAPGSPALHSAGYAGGDPVGEGPHQTRSCRVRAIIGRSYLNDCPAMPGNSGSPIFSPAAPGVGRSITVYAMQAAAAVSPWDRTPAPSGMGLAIPVNQIGHRIGPFLTGTSQEKASGEGDNADRRDSSAKNKRSTSSVRPAQADEKDAQRDPQSIRISVHGLAL